ncbi:MAG: DUF4405 domain-containing protein [bacterium]|nr:DUF4405 domain-containing protein [bacterium]
MQLSKNISNSIRLNFYLNLLNFLPFLIVIITGLILQIEYHMLKLPDDYFISGLNKSGWLILHKISASISLAGIIAHCALHRKFISILSNKILRRKSLSPASLSYWLFIISIPAYLIAMTSWILFDHGDPARFLLVEIHDKLALLLFPL